MKLICSSNDEYVLNESKGVLLEWNAPLCLPPKQTKIRKKLNDFFVQVRIDFNFSTL